MTAQEENELICEKLLGWERVYQDPSFRWLIRSSGFYVTEAPSFTIWPEAGPLLEALRAKCAIDIHSKSGGGWMLVPSRRNPERLGYIRLSDHIGDELPPLIRAAALEYIRSLS